MTDLRVIDRFSDLAGSILTSQLPVSGASAGVYTLATVTVDIHGIVTAISSGTPSSALAIGDPISGSTPGNILIVDGSSHLGQVTTASLTFTTSQISGFDTQVRTSRLDQMAAPTATVNLNSQKISNLLSPTADLDAANKAYVDGARSGLDVKQSVRVATTTAGTLASSFANGSTVDGISLVTGDRILLKDQATGSENGIYTVNASGVPTRATDADASAEVTPGMFAFVEEGAVNADSGWVLTNDGAISLGTTALTFVQFSGAGQVVAGAGLTKFGNTLAIGAGTGITVNADDVAISNTYPGQSSIVTVGTIATGVWQGTPVGPVYGGTGLSSYTLGDLPYASAANTLAKLAGNTSATKKYLSQTGNGTTSAAPAWDTVAAGVTIGDPIGGSTVGRIPHVGTGLVWADSLGLNYDGAGLGLGTATPKQILDVVGGASIGKSWPAGYDTLNGAINSSVTSITLNSTAGLPVRGILKFADASPISEWISYTGISSNTLTGVTRGILGTTAASWPDGTIVRNVLLAVSSGSAFVSPILAVTPVSVILNTTKDHSDIGGQMTFKFAATTLAYFGYNSNGWLEISDGTRFGFFGVTSGGMFVGTASNHPLIFRIANSECVAIDTNHRLGVNVTTGIAGQAHIVCANASTPGLIIEAASTPTANLVEVRDASHVPLSTISENGYWTTRKTSAPADAELSNSEASWWLDPTPGATKVKFKAKDSGGTVRTGEIALS